MESRRRPGDPLSEDRRFNVLNHELVPLHEIVPDEDVPALLEQYRIQKEQLPKIRSNDPAARVCDAKAGQILRVTRRSPTAGLAIAYRLVVEAL